MHESLSSNEFLKVADQVLQLIGRPLRVRDIVQKALDENLLLTKGKTPINSMRARLSEHIKKHGDHSKFMRVQPNKIALRKWDYEEFKAKPFEKDNNEEVNVCITQESLDKKGRFFGFQEDYSKYISILEDTNNLRLLKKKHAKSNYNVKRLVSYVVLKDATGKILSYRRGNFGNKESLLKGVLCIGFGGHVNIDDIDLFGLSNAGIVNSAYREIYEEIKGLRIPNPRLVGVINDDSSSLGLNHFAFVFESILPDTFNDKTFSKELSINQVKLLDVSELWNMFHELEFWSQLLLKKYINKNSSKKFTFIKSKKRMFMKNPLLIIGEIGSGKTEISKFLQEEYGANHISTRSCVAEIIRIEDFGDQDRTSFQYAAMKLISNSNGIDKLANLICEKIQNAKNNFIIIDGVRNVGTYEIIKRNLPDTNIMYIDTPRDIAFKFYKERSKPRTPTIDEFRKARQHDVEREILFFKDIADVYVYNGESLKYLYKELKKWMKNYNI